MRNVWHRVFVLIIGIPAGVLGSVVLSATPVFLVVNAAKGKWELVWLVPLVLAMPALLGGIRLATGRIVAAVQGGNREQ